MAILHAKSPDGTEKNVNLDKIVTGVKGNSESSYRTGDVNITAANIGAAASGHTHSNMTAATADAAGTAGFVPAPAAGKQASFLRGDGTWAVPTNTTYSAGTAALLNAGTDTTNRVWTAKILSAFVESKCTPGSSIATNGYVKLDSGLIIQWGVASLAKAQGDKSITFPISFASSCYTMVTASSNSGSGGSYDYFYQIKSLSKTGATVYCQDVSGYLPDSPKCYYIALGK